MAIAVVIEPRYQVWFFYGIDFVLFQHSVLVEVNGGIASRQGMSRSLRQPRVDCAMRNDFRPGSENTGTTDPIEIESRIYDVLDGPIRKLCLEFCCEPTPERCVERIDDDDAVVGDDKDGRVTVLSRRVYVAAYVRNRPRRGAALRRSASAEGDREDQNVQLDHQSSELRGTWSCLSYRSYGATSRTGIGPLHFRDDGHNVVASSEQTVARLLQPIA